MKKILIPSIIHQVWIGPNPLPESYLMFRQAFHRDYPDFEYRLYRNDSIPKLNHQRLFDAAPSWSVKSDIIRYQQVLEHGGFYWDIDFESLKPALELFEGRLFVGCNETHSVKYCSPGFFGAVPTHIVLQCVDILLSKMTEDEIRYGKPNIVTGPHFFRRAIDMAAEHGTHVEIFPPEYFYPLKSTGGFRRGHERAYAVHHWAGSWTKEATWKQKPKSHSS